ncbi:MAG: hypothetical protein KBD63_04375 [Bacteriovoracaceae bacterium]|nr:hypothetical protein [Bacteriovoracaceae bacterium]
MAIKRSIYLINPKFQIKFSLFVCSLIFVSSLIYPITIYELVNSFISHTAFHASKEFLEESRVKLILALCVYQLIFISIVFIICIFQSHKIAGPLYKIKKALLEIKTGIKPDVVVFRKGDHFKDLAENLNEVFGDIDLPSKKRNEEFKQQLKEYESFIPMDKKEAWLKIQNDYFDSKSK